MIDDLEFLRGEATKLQKAIRKDDTRNYKRYATLFQAYLTTTANVRQMEAYQRQKAEEEKRKAEEERIKQELTDRAVKEQAIKEKIGSEAREKLNRGEKVSWDEFQLMLGDDKEDESET